ncbi:MAG: ankyrin repeat domain-containing protein [Gammaproteobacteria bacterium]
MRSTPLSTTAKLIATDQHKKKDGSKNREQKHAAKAAPFNESPTLAFSVTPNSLNLPTTNALFKQGQNIANSTADRYYAYQKALVTLLVRQPLYNKSYIQPPDQELLTSSPEALYWNISQLTYWINQALRCLHIDDNDPLPSDLVMLLTLINKCAHLSLYFNYAGNQDEITCRDIQLRSMREWGVVIHKWIIKLPPKIAIDIMTETLSTFLRLAFQLSVIDNNIEELENCLKIDPTLIKSVDGIGDGTDALFIACFRGYLTMAALLIDKGAPVNAYNRTGLTPLNIACGYGHRHIVSYLLNNAAADPNFPNALGNNAINAYIQYITLHTAEGTSDNIAEKEILKLLLERGGQYSQEMAEDRFKPLQSMKQVVVRDNSRRDILQTLDFYGKQYQKDKQLQIQEARKQQKPTTFDEVKVENPLPKKTSDATSTPPKQKKRIGSSGKKSDRDALTPQQILYLKAAETGNIAEADAVLAKAKTDGEKNLLWNTQDQQKRTPLMIALSHSEPEQDLEQESKNENKYFDFICNQLFKSGRQTAFRLQDEDFRTCIHYAVIHKQLSALNRFATENPYEFRLVIDTDDIDYKTALHHAITQGSPAIAQVLINHGANPNLKNPDDETAFTLVAAIKDEALRSIFESVLAPPKEAKEEVVVAKTTKRKPGMSREQEDKIITDAFTLLKTHQKSSAVKQNQVQTECAIAERLLYRRYENAQDDRALPAGKDLASFLRLERKFKQMRDLLLQLEDRFKQYDASLQLWLATSDYKLGYYVKAENRLLAISRASEKVNLQILLSNNFLLQRIYRKQARHDELSAAITVGLKLLATDQFTQLENLPPYFHFRSELNLLRVEYITNQKDSDHILARYREMLNQYNNHPYIVTEIAWHLFKIEDYDQALLEFKKLAVIDRQVYLTGSARCYQMLRYIHKDQWNALTRLCEQNFSALEREYTDNSVSQEFAVTYFSANKDPKKFDQHRKKFEKLMNQFPTEEVLSKYAHYCWYSKKEADALNIYKKMSQLFPDSVNWRLDLFYKHFTAGNLQQALIICESVLQTGEKRTAAPLLAKSPALYQAYIEILLYMEQWQVALEMRTVCRRECASTPHLFSTIDDLFTEYSIKLPQVEEEKTTLATIERTHRIGLTSELEIHPKVKHDLTDASLNSIAGFSQKDLSEPYLALTILFKSALYGLRLSDGLKNQLIIYAATLKQSASRQDIQTAPDIMRIANLPTLIADHFHKLSTCGSNPIDMYYTKLHEYGFAELIFPGTGTAPGNKDSMEWYSSRLSVYYQNPHNHKIGIYLIMSAYENSLTLGTHQFLPDVQKTLTAYGLDEATINTTMTTEFLKTIERHAVSSRHFILQLQNQNQPTHQIVNSR